MTDSPQAAPLALASPRLSWPVVARLIRWNSQTGTLLLLLPTMWSLVLAAQGIPSLRLFVTFALGSFVMRSAGVILNDLADRSFDRQVARTQLRPLASGELTSWQAALIAGLFLATAGLLVLTLNPLAILLSPVAVILACLYPFAKRVIHVPQAILGIAFGWGTIMAWAASRGTIEMPAWMLFLATVCWAIGYDTIYALQDREDDRRISVKSAALFFGEQTWLAVSVSLAAMLLLLALAGWMTEIGWVFYAVLGAGGGLCLKQALEVKRPVTPLQAFRLFHQHVWLGAVILAGMIAGFLL